MTPTEEAAVAWLSLRGDVQHRVQDKVFRVHVDEDRFLQVSVSWYRPGFEGAALGPHDVDRTRSVLRELGRGWNARL